MGWSFTNCVKTCCRHIIDSMVVEFLQVDFVYVPVKQYICYEIRKFKMLCDNIVLCSYPCGYFIGI